MALPSAQSRFTAGAIPVYNDKGELTMQKVKVTRYVSGQRPLYAGETSSESEGEEEILVKPSEEEERIATTVLESDIVIQEPEEEDRRLKRLREVQDQSFDQNEYYEEDTDMVAVRRYEESDEEKSEEEEEEFDEEEMEQHRMRMRQLARQREEEEELMLKEEEKEMEGESEDESEEYEEYTDSEDETGPRLKPVFVRKSDRITIKEKEKLEEEERGKEELKRRQSEERRRESQRIVGEIVSHEMQKKKTIVATTQGEVTVDTDDEENAEEEYEAWKVRELKRIKRDREEREALEKERQEIERIHNLTEEERMREFKLNPKDNPLKAPKGKYRFLQKYYHRGAFYLEDDTVITRDTSAPTLEDHFDKTILPKIMQVKNFGRSGRTKYTHLVDQDTTDFEAAWSHNNPVTQKFTIQGGGMKQTFNKPSAKKRKT